MQSKIAFFTAILMSVFFFQISFAQSNSEACGIGRYLMYELELNKKPTPFLVDTQTGKVWIYGTSITFGSGGGFKGVTVEGLAYAADKSEELKKQIQAWHTDGLIKKDVKGYLDAVFHEFSYSMDLLKAKEINDKLNIKK